MKKKERKLKKIPFIMFPIVIICLLLGIFIGMSLQQMLIGELLNSFGRSLDGTNIEVNVDFNETILINGVKDISRELNEIEYKEKN